MGTQFRNGQFLLVGAAVVWFTAVGVIGSPARQDGTAGSTAETASHPEAPPTPELLEATFEQMCSQCHESSQAKAFRRTRLGWEEVINTMITQQGAVGSDEDFGLALRYLLSQYGLVNVNTAPAEDLEFVLEISEKAAGDIIAFRTKKGKIADFETLLTVPGLDAKKLESKKKAIQF